MEYVRAAALAFAIAGCSTAAALQPEGDRVRLRELESGVSDLHSEVQDLDSRLDRVESGVSDTKSKLEENASGGAALFLFGAFCALWAQNTGRSAWAWFFFGIFFSVITVVVLLAKNSREMKTR